jgi:hypothetical protein
VGALVIVIFDPKSGPLHRLLEPVEPGTLEELAQDRFQAHGPGGVQFAGLCLPEEKTAAMGDRNLSTATPISLNETGT